MVKKKANKYKRSIRRQNEIAKAQAKTAMRSAVVSAQNTEVGLTEKKSAHELNLRVIRTDLLKTLLFVFFVLTILIILKIRGL